MFTTVKKKFIINNNFKEKTVSSTKNNFHTSQLEHSTASILKQGAENQNFTYQNTKLLPRNIYQKIKNNLPLLQHSVSSTFKFKQPTISILKQPARSILKQSLTLQNKPVSNAFIFKQPSSCILKESVKNQSLSTAIAKMQPTEFSKKIRQNLPVV